MADIVVAGHLCLDILPQMTGGLPGPGHMVEVGSPLLATGGAVANTGLALHTLGVTVRLVGRVGADMFGAAVRALIARRGAALADALLTAPAEATATTIILSPPGVDRMFIHTPGVNATFSAGDVRDAALVGARLLHFGYPPTMARMAADDGAQLVALLRRAHARGLATALDMAMPDQDGRGRDVDWRRVLANVLPNVDFFLPSADEMLLMLDRPRYDALLAEARGDFAAAATPALLRALADEMLALGAKVVMLKCGHRGVYLRTAGAARLAQIVQFDLSGWADRELWSPAFVAQVVGTTGAGDATVAGFLAALLRGAAPEHALTMACAVGACSVEAADATSGVRGWDATAARVAAGWPTVSERVKG